MSILKKYPIFPLIFLLALTLAISGFSKPAVLMTSTHDLGMASEKPAHGVGFTQPSKDKDALCSGVDLNKIMAPTSLEESSTETSFIYIWRQEFGQYA